ncbi:response regulator [Ramlibacter sp. AN1015]|uniref:response regulator n=1 Tax=Ramlibacter sp. AN1015 TaxID=3133428 RepID=UPI0030BC1C79
MNRSAPAASDEAFASVRVPALLESLPYGLGLFDRAQRLVHCNSRFQVLLGLGDAPVPPGLDFAALVERTRRAGVPGAQPGGLMLSDGNAPAQPRRVERLMGTGTLLEIHFTALADGGMAMSLLDITASRQTVEALRRSRTQSELLQGQVRQAREEAQRAVQGRHQFIANMAHELRTPVNAILGMLQLIEGAVLDERPREWLAHARDAGRSLVGVMDDIMDFASVEAGEVTLQPRTFELEQLLRELSAAFAGTLGERPQEFVFDIDPSLPPRLVADDRRLRQVLMHLGGNAIKFGDGKPVVLRMAQLARKDGTVELQVDIVDQGIGIEAARLQELMQGFGQAESAASRRFGGNGLGLAICRELLRLMGSELRVRSVPGQGSSFGFVLRLPEGTGAAVTATPVVTHGLRVLVADDRAATRQAYARMAQSLGWQVTEAASLTEALDVLGNQRQIGAALVGCKLAGGEPFSAALRIADAFPGRALAVVALGNAAGRQQLARIAPERRRIGAYLGGPATASMLADAVNQAQGAAQPPARPGATPTGKPLQGIRVLVAEDNENNQIVTRDLLVAQGAQVEIAVDGLDTLTSIVANGRYDAILMDWQMPNMDGLEATREIRQIVGFENIPIIALTANASSGDREACLEAGMDAHLAKPVDAGELVATLLRHTRVASAAEVPSRRPAAAGAVAPPSSAVRIDRDAAMARLGGDANLYARVVERFRQEAPRALAAIDQARQRGDRKEAHRLAHTLKGNAGTVGAQQLAEAAQQTETALAATPSPADQAALETLRTVLDATLRQLAA